MAIYGALGENPGKTGRRGEYFDRGEVTVTGSATVTVPLPVRKVSLAVATIKATSAPGLDPILCTVGNYSGNTFTIYLWKATSNANPTLIASTTATPVEWFAVGTL